MKTTSTSKRLVSLLLAVIMVLSMMTVGMVTSFAAQTDIAQTGANYTVYFTHPGWSKIMIHYWCGYAGSIWPGIPLDYSHKNDYQQDVYKVSIPSDTTNIQFNDGTNQKQYEATITGKKDGVSYYIEDNTLKCVDGTGSGTFGQSSSGGGGETTDEFPIDFVDGSRTIYLVDEAGWGSSTCYAWTDGTTDSNKAWPGEDMTDTGKTMNGYKIYSYTVDSAFNKVIFYNANNKRTGDLDFTQYGYYNNKTYSWSTKSPTTPTQPTEPTTPWDPGDFTQICFRDDASEAIDTADADMYVQFDGGDKTKMTKTVDKMSGHDMWYADIPASSTSVKFIRASVIDKAEWNTWSPNLSDCTTGLYRATGWGTGSWGTSTESFAIPNKKDINDYSFGIWADTRGESNLYDLVIARKLSSSEFHLYLPSNTPASVKLYTSFAALTIGSTPVTDGTAVTLENGESYSMSYKQTEYDTSTKTATLRVYRTTKTATLMFQTKRDLFTGTVGSLSVSGYKDAIETKGNYYLYGETGEWENAPEIDDETGDEIDMSVLKKIKGRGNSSFEASMRLYGKYAYNFNLDQKNKLIDGAQKAKKWCLLANNPDVTMLRNTFIYQLADELGVKYAPETRLVDVYDNGYYLGAYVITEKVEYGKNTLMNDMKNLDDGNEDANIEAYNNNKDIMDTLEGHLIQKTSSCTTNGKTYSYQYTTSDDTTNWPYHQPEDFQTYNYLLEFELHNRYTNEASWFVSPRTNQAVVVKYPEFATKDEMEWIISEYEKAEAAIYANDTNAIKAAVDVDSFAKMYLLQELSINLDSCATSYYIHNDQATDKLVASPIWDYDWAFGAYAKDLKYIYNGSSVTTSGNMSDPQQMFVKNKALQTDSGGRADGKSWISNYNFQAKLVHNSYVWERCQYFWTNDLADLLYNYVKDDSSDSGIIIDTYLLQFESAVNMNNARWGSFEYTGDNWGTKVTTDYTPYTYDFKVGNCGTSGSSSKNYSNSVYYLNDWIKIRRNYMSDSEGGNLYNASLLDPYKLNSVTMNATQSGNTVIVNVAIDATNNNVPIADSDKFYDLYVNGSKVDTYTAADTATVTLVDNVETEIYVVGYIKGADGNVNKSKETDKQKFTHVVTGPEYKVENVKFEGVQSADEKTVKVTPAAYVTFGDEEVKPDKINYTIYRNGAVYDTYTFETTSVDVTLVEGMVNQIYIVVSLDDAPTVKGTSATQKFSCKVPETKVSVTIKFKSSSSVRYIPSIKVNGNTTAEKMTIGEEIGWNASGTQSYNWFTANVELALGKATNITFTNSYSMNATIAVTPAEAGQTFYFGVDNLNQGTNVEDLTGKDENIKNFVKSASHMVHNDVYDPAIATTSLGGTIYKLGDTDVDNKLTAIDATKTQMALVGKTELSATGEALADFNLDGRKSIMDVTLTQVYLTQ